MLVLEIAGGVVLGLLLYRGIVSFATSRNLTIPAAIFVAFFGIAYLSICALFVLVGLGFFALAFYVEVMRPPEIRQYLPQLGWALGIYLVLGLGFTIWTDRRNLAGKD
jgi:hypothetical protein